MNVRSFFYKGIKKFISFFTRLFDKIFSSIVFVGNDVKYRNFKSSGVPYVMVARGGKCSIGKNFAMNNGAKGNPIGCFQKCTFFVNKNAELIIGENVGISQTALICHEKITVGNYVKIGGGVCIYDTDFHSLDSEIRKSKNDFSHKITKPVFIGDNVFIGAHSTILKGVTIGENSIVGACSVVTKNVPANEIWAGNPAIFIRKTKLYECN